MCTARLIDKLSHAGLAAELSRRAAVPARVWEHTAWLIAGVGSRGTALHVLSGAHRHSHGCPYLRA